MAGILIHEGKLDQQELIEHWCHINGKEKTSFIIYKKNVVRLWRLRNQFKWKIVDKNENDIFKGLNFEELIKSLK